MKKEILLVIFIVVAIVTAHIASQRYVKNFFDSITEDLDKIEEKIFSNNFETSNLEKDIDDVKNKWDEKYNFIACFIDHDVLEKVEMQFVSISAYIKVKDYDRSINEAEKCKFMLELIKDKDSLSTINIF